MGKYKLLMNGTNFLIGKEKHGFYQTIFLESESHELAEKNAVDIIRNSDLKEIINNNPNDPPMIYLEEIEEIDSFDNIKERISGRSLYLED